MLNVLRTKLSLATAIIGICAAIQPGKLSAQTSGVGSDGYTRVLWRGTNGSISVWKLDSNLVQTSYRQYGPYNGWTPIALTVGSDNYSRLLWRGTDGAVSLWLLDPNLNFYSYKQYGPYYGWIAESISIDTADRLRLIWRETDGSISIWNLDATLNYLGSRVYGPYFGWDPATAAAAKSGAAKLTPAAPETDNVPAEMKRPVSAPVPQQ